MQRTKIAVGLAVAGLFLLLTGVPAHAQYEPPETTTTIVGGEIPTITVVRGQTVDVSGSSCAPGAEVVITLDDGTTLATTTAGDDGTFQVTITVPLDISLGEHLVTAACEAGPDARAQSKISFGSAGAANIDVDGILRQFIRLNVVDDSGTGSGGASSGGGGSSLPRTGSSNTAPLVGIGAGALVLGAAFVYGSRRPRTA